MVSSATMVMEFAAQKHNHNSFENDVQVAPVRLGLDWSLERPRIKRHVAEQRTVRATRNVFERETQA